LPGCVGLCQAPAWGCLVRLRLPLRRARARGGREPDGPRSDQHAAAAAWACIRRSHILMIYAMFGLGNVVWTLDAGVRQRAGMSPELGAGARIDFRR